MIVNDKQNQIFEINEGENGKCKIKILDYLYFRIFYTQGDRVNELNAKLLDQEVDFKDTDKIKELVSEGNNPDYNWEIEGLKYNDIPKTDTLQDVMIEGE